MVAPFKRLGHTDRVIFGIQDSPVDNPLPIKVVDDGSGLGKVSVHLETSDVVVGGGTQYAEGATASSATGTVAMAKRPVNIIDTLEADVLGPLRVAQKTTSEVLNGDFEDGSGALPDYWVARANSGDVTPTWDTTDPYSGAKCIKFAPSGVDVAGQIYQTQKIDVSTLHAVQVVCFSKVATTGGGAATCNFGVQVNFYDEQDNLIQTVGTLYARNSTTHGTYAATYSTAIFTVSTGAVRADFAFGVSDMSSNCEVFIDSMSGYRVPMQQASGSFGFPIEQIHATVAGKYPAMVASELIGSAIPEHAVLMGFEDGSGNLLNATGDATGLDVDALSDTVSSAIGSRVIAVGMRNSAGNADNFQGQSTNADAFASSASGKHLQVANFPYFYNGTNWDRFRGNLTDGLLVNLGTNNDVTVTGTVTANQGGTWSATVTQATASSLNAQVVGELAHDAVDSGNPIKFGGRASSTTPSAVASGDRVNAWFTPNGALHTNVDNTITVDLGKSIGTGANTAVSVGTASTAILASNANRVGLILINNGTQTVYIQFGATATVASSMPLLRGQPIIIMFPANVTMAIAGIVSTGTCEVRVVEFTV